MSNYPTPFDGSSLPTSFGNQRPPPPPPGRPPAQNYSNNNNNNNNRGQGRGGYNPPPGLQQRGGRGGSTGGGSTGGTGGNYFGPNNGGRGGGGNDQYRANTNTGGRGVDRQGRGGGGNNNNNRNNDNINNNNRNRGRPNYSSAPQFPPLPKPAGPSLTIAVEGCAHGELPKIYDAISRESRQTGKTVDLLICCGDFQSLRNSNDLDTLQVPDKYKELGNFHKYYSGEIVAPVLTIFIGGNHEASSSLTELFYGGWVAPNIYYLGQAGVINVRGIRIAGLTGIYKENHFNLGHYEQPPYNPTTLRSVYHLRSTEIYKLSNLNPSELSIFLSHDWPTNIAQHGDKDYLFAKKTFLRKEVMDGSLGSPPGEYLLNLLKPRFWFAAHLHVKFGAVVKHDPLLQAEGDENTTKFVAVEGTNDSCKTDGGMKSLTEQMTTFLSLDKCLPKREFLEILTLPLPQDQPIYESSDQVALEYDVEWLAVLRRTHYLTSSSRREIIIPSETFTVSSDEKKWVNDKLQGANGSLVIPQNFVKTVPTQSELEQMKRSDKGYRCDGRMVGNPQTDALLGLLELGHNGVTVRHDPKGSSGNGDNGGGGGRGGYGNAVDDGEVTICTSSAGVVTKLPQQEDDGNEIDLEDEVGDNEIFLDYEGENDEEDNSPPKEIKRRRVIGGLSMPKPTNGDDDEKAEEAVLKDDAELEIDDL